VKHGYYPIGFDKNWACDFVIDTFEDLGATGVFKPFIAESKLTTEQQENLVKGMDKVNGILERHLENYHGWKLIAGNEISIGDFKALARYHSTALNKTVKHP
jgi:hypothetical protein